MAKRRSGKPTGTMMMQRRLGRAALLRGTALQAVFGLVFLAPAPFSPAASQPAPSARPQGGQVVAGSAAISNSANATVINQSSNRAAIDWQSFNVGRDQSVNFQQPGAGSVTLNRVLGADPSAIAGRISANGQIVLTNPNGVVFHQGSQVNAQSVIVSTAGISTRNFMAGRMAFDQPGNPNARIENQGTITVKQAGLAALVAPSVQNSGVINARMGQVILAGAAAHTLDMYGDGLVSIDVTKQVRQAPLGPDGKVVTALVTNTGVIAADGGVVQLTASAADGVVQTLVRAGGSIRANTVGNQAGRIEITGTGGSVVIEGRVAADGRAAGTTGGTVTLSGSESTAVAAGARVSANGNAGGGTVAVGTTLARARTLGPAPSGTSARTTVAAGARISADAKGNGSGGRVTILSTKATVVDGAVSARGGRQGGDGGTIELSGEQGFRLTGTADTSAPQGKLGTIVLDPRDLLITATPTGTNATPTPDANGSVLAYNNPDTNTDAYVTPSQLSGLAGNVRLQATRDLTVVDSFTITAGQATLEAGRNLTVNAGATITSQGPISLSAATATIPNYEPTGTLTVSGRLNAGNIYTGGDVTLSAGSGGILVNGTISAPFSVTVSTPGSLTQTAGSSIQTQVLAGTAGNVSLTSTANVVSAVGSSGYGVFNVTGAGGSFILTAGTALTVNNVAGRPGITVPTGQTVALRSDTLTLTAPAGATALSAPGGTVSLQPLTNNRGITLTSSTTKPTNVLALSTAEAALIGTGTLLLQAPGGPITFGQVSDARIDLVANGNFAQVAVSTTGTVQQNAPLTAAALTGTAGAVFLSNAANSIPVVQSLATTGPIDLATAGDLTIGGTVSASNSLFLRAGGNITVPGTATVSSTTFVSLDAGDTAISGSNAAASLTVAGVVTATFGATLSAGSGGIALSGTVSGNAVGLYTGGAVTQTTGAVNTTSLEGTVGSLSLTSAANGISGIARGGFVQLRTTGATGDMEIVTGKALRIGSASMAGGLFVPSGRKISLTTDQLTIDPSGSGAQTVNAPSGVFTLAPYTPGGPILLTAGAKPSTGLSLTSAELQQIDATTLQLGSLSGTTPTAGPITLGLAGETLDLGLTGISSLLLYSAGAVTQGGPLGVTTVSGKAASLDLSYGTASGSNFISQLDGFTATGGDLALHTSGRLAVSGTVDATGNVALSSGNAESAVSMTLTGNITGNTVSLNSLGGSPSISSGILQSGGIITANTLTAAGGVNVDLGAANQISNLGDFSAYNRAILNTVRPLVITGAVSATLSDVTLTANGITQTAASSITAPFLGGSSGAATVLDSRNNAVAGMNAFTQTVGDFTLVTGSPNLRFNGALVANSGSFTFVANQVGLAPSVAGGVGITATSGSVNFAPYTPGRRIELIGNTAPDAASLSVAQPLLSRITTAQLGLGDANSTGAINIANANETVNLSGRAATLALRTTGAVTEGISPGTQNGGGTLGLTVGTVTGSVGSLSLTAPANAISAVTNLSATQSVAVASNLALSATGAITADATTGTVSLASTKALTTAATLSARNVTLSAAGGVLSLSDGSITAPGTLTLSAPGQSITQTGATLVAGTLTGNAATTTLGTATNDVATLGSFTTSGAFLLNDARSLTVAGPFSAASANLGTTGDLSFTGAVTVPGTLALTVGNAIFQATDSALTVGTLTGTAAAAGLSGNNLVTNLGAFTVTDGFSLITYGATTVNGPLRAASAILSTGGNLVLASDLTIDGALQLSARGADISQTGGVISADTLSGGGNAVTLNRANLIANLGQISAGNFQLTDARTLTVVGPVSAGSATLAVTGDLGIAGAVTVTNALTLSVSGAVTQTGAITAGTLTGTAGSARLDGANSIATLGSFTTGNGSFALRDTRSLTVSGPLSSSTDTSIGVTGDLLLTGRINSPGTVVLTASGAITQGDGAITTGTLAGSATSAQLVGNNVITTLGGFATSGPLILSNIRSLTVAGPVTAGSATFSIAGGLAFAGNLTVTGTLGLSTVNGVTQSAGTVTANLLQGSAASLLLDGSTNNMIATLGGFTSRGALTLTNGRSLTVTGPISATTAVLNVAGALTLSGNVTVPGLLTLAAAGAITQPGGTLTAGTLAGFAATATLGAANSVATLGAFITTGSFALTDTRSLTVAGPVTAANASLGITGDLAFSGTVTVPGTLTTTVSGAITQPGGTVTAGTLTGSAASAALGAANAVTTLGDFTTTGAFALNDAQSLSVAGTLKATQAQLSATGNLLLPGTITLSGALALTATGNIDQTGGTITASTISGSAAVAGLTGSNTVGTLAGFTTTGAFALSDQTSLTVTGPLSAANASLSVTGDLALSGTVAVPGTLTLAATGAITQPNGSITAGTLSGSAASAALGAGNSIATLASFRSTGALTLNDTRSLALTGPLSATDTALTIAGDLVLSGTVATAGTLGLTVSGAITQPGGAIQANTLTGSAGDASFTQRGNAVGTLATFTSARDFSFVDSAALTIAGPVSAGTGRTISLVADAPTFARGGTLSAPGGTVALTEYTAGRGIVLGGPSSFNPDGIVTASRLVIGGTTAGPITITGAVNFAGIDVLDLRSGGAITETGAGAIRVGTLTGQAASATLNGANQIGTLGFATTGAFSFNDTQALTVAGPLSGSSLALTTTSDLIFAGAVSTSGTLSLTAGGAITQPGGGITAATVTGSATSAAFGSTGNQIATLGGFTTTGSLALTDAASLTVTGPISASAVSLSVTGNLTLSGTIATPGTLGLTVSGAITQLGGAIQANTLTGSAGDASFTQRGNAVGTLATFTSARDFSLVDSASLTIAGPVSAGTGRTISLVADAPTFARGGTLSAPGGTVALTEYTAGRGIVLGGPSSFNPDGIVTASRLVIGGTTAGPITITGAVNFAGIDVLDLRSGGAITETGAGAIRVGTLTGQAASATLNGANQIGTLGFATTGAFSFNDTQALTVAGPLSGSSLALTTTSDLIFAGAVSTSGTLSLTAGGAITQPSGSVTAATVTGSATSAAFGSTGNQIATLGGFTTPGNFVLADGTSLTVAGPLSAANASLSVTGNLTLAGTVAVPGTLGLAATGAITQPSGAVTAGTLSGNAASLALGSATNSIATLGAFTTTDGLALADARSLTIAGPVNATTASLSVTGDLVLAGTVTVPNALNLVATGAITQPGGTLTAGTLFGSAASANLGAANRIGTLGGFSTTGSLTLTDATSLAVAGPVSASSASLAVTGDLVLAGNLAVPGSLSLSASGAITQPGGAIAAGTLSGNAGSAALTGTTNSITTLGSFATTGSFALTDAAALTVAGPLSGSDLTLSSGGNLVLSGGIVTPGTLTVNAAGTITQPRGTIAASVLTGSGTTVTLAAANRIATLAGFTASGAFSLADTQSLVVTGPLAAASTALGVTGDLAFAGPISTGTLSISASGAVTEPGGTVTASSLSGNAASLTLGSAANRIGAIGPLTVTGAATIANATALPVTGLAAASAAFSVAGGLTLTDSTIGTLSGSAASLGATNTSLATLAGFTTSGTLALNDTRSLAVTGPVSASAASFGVTGDLTLAGNVAAGTLALNASGAVTQPGGAIIAGTVSGNAASISLGAANQIVRIGTLTTTGASQVTAANALIVDGPVTGTAIGLSVAGDLTLSGPIATPGTLTLTATGAIAQPGGAIAAGTLTGTAGSASLAQRNNAITTLGAFGSAGDFTLVNSTPLAIAGTVSVGSGRTLTLSNDTPRFAVGGSLTAPGGTVALTEYMPGRGITLASGADVPPVSAATLRLGSADGGPVAITGALNLGNVGTLDLRSGGAITESGDGAIQVGRLTGQAGSVALGGANRIGVLGGFATSGDFSLNNVQALAATGALTGSGITLASTGDLVLSATVNTPGTLTLVSGGTISQPDGSITAGALTGQAIAARIDRAGNSVPTLAGFTTVGDFTFTDSRSLVVSAPVDPNVVTLNVDGTLTLDSSVTGGTVVLNATGGIVQNRGGRVVADTLTGRADSASLSGDNQIAALGNFTTRGGFALNTGGPLAVTGTVGDTQSISIGSGGALALSGAIRSPVVALRAAGGITQTAGTIEAGSLALSAAGPITTAGNVTAGTATLATPGAVTQSGGILALGILTGSTGSLDLGRGGSATIAGISNLSATGTLTVVDAAPLRISGTLAAPFLAVTATNSLTLDGGTIRTNGLPLTAQAGATPAGPGSTLAVVAGTSGSTTFQQLGTTSVVSYDGSSATLRLQLPATGGQLTLNDLQAANADLVFGVGGGTATGRLIANNLTYLGDGGSARLTGEVRQRSGTLAAQLSRVSPQVSDSYTLNGCALQSFSCTPDVNQLVNAITAIASTLRPDILTLDVLDLSVTRDRDDPTLLLPNISERDY